MKKSPIAHALLHQAGSVDPVYLFGGQEYASFQENIPRWCVTAADVLTAGVTTYVYLTATQNQAITQCSVFVNTATSSPTLVRLGLYTISGTALTLVFCSADVHASKLNSNPVVSTVAFTLAGDISTPLANYTLTRGTRYAVGILCVGGTAAKLYGQGFSSSAFYDLAPVMAKSSASGKTELPTSEATPTTSTVCPWVALG